MAQYADECFQAFGRGVQPRLKVSLVGPRFGCRQVYCSFRFLAYALLLVHLHFHYFTAYIHMYTYLCTTATSVHPSSICLFRLCRQLQFISSGIHLYLLISNIILNPRHSPLLHICIYKILCRDSTNLRSYLLTY